MADVAGPRAGAPALPAGVSSPSPTQAAAMPAGVGGVMLVTMGRRRHSSRLLIMVDMAAAAARTTLCAGRELDGLTPSDVQQPGQPSGVGPTHVEKMCGDPALLQGKFP
jgi:hypothetical protein